MDEVLEVQVRLARWVETLGDIMLKAEDLWPLVARMPRTERVRLARLALVKTVLAPETTDAERYAAMPVQADEFGGVDDDMMAWDADGWEDVR